MKKFRFRFDSVLRVRKVHEKEALSALAESQRVYQSEVARKEILKTELKNALQRREMLGNQPVPISTFKTEQDFISGLKQRLIQADQAIFRASRGVEKFLRAFLVAKKRTRVIEILYDRAYADYRKQVMKEEQKANEDMALMRARLKEESL
jgi:flagellar export protein FliJ